MVRNYFLSSILVCLPWLCKADSLDFFRSTGKIYSVVAVIVVLFLVLAIYLIRLDKRITQLEQNKKHGS